MDWKTYSEESAENIHVAKIAGGVLMRITSYSGVASSTSVVFIPGAVIKNVKGSLSIVKGK